MGVRSGFSIISKAAAEDPGSLAHHPTSTLALDQEKNDPNTVHLVDLGSIIFRFLHARSRDFCYFGPFGCLKRYGTNSTFESLNEAKKALKQAFIEYLKTEDPNVAGQLYFIFDRSMRVKAKSKERQRRAQATRHNRTSDDLEKLVEQATTIRNNHQHTKMAREANRSLLRKYLIIRQNSHVLFKDFITEEDFQQDENLFSQSYKNSEDIMVHMEAFCERPREEDESGKAYLNLLDDTTDRYASLNDKLVESQRRINFIYSCDEADLCIRRISLALKKKRNSISKFIVHSPDSDLTFLAYNLFDVIIAKRPKRFVTYEALQAYQRIDRKRLSKCGIFNSSDQIANWHNTASWLGMIICRAV